MEEKKQRQKSIRPTYQEMVFQAIMSLNEKSGSSVAAIFKFLDDNYESVKKNKVKIQLQRLADDGLIVKQKRSFKLSHGMGQVVKQCVKHPHLPMIPRLLAQTPPRSS